MASIQPSSTTWTEQGEGWLAIIGEPPLLVAWVGQLGNNGLRVLKCDAVFQVSILFLKMLKVWQIVSKGIVPRTFYAKILGIKWETKIQASFTWGLAFVYHIIVFVIRYTHIYLGGHQGHIFREHLRTNVSLVFVHLQYRLWDNSFAVISLTLQ